MIKCWAYFRVYTVIAFRLCKAAPAYEWLDRSSLSLLDQFEFSVPLEGEIVVGNIGIFLVFLGFSRLFNFYPSTFTSFPSPPFRARSMCSSSVFWALANIVYGRITWGGDGRCCTAINEPVNMDMTPQGSFHIFILYIEISTIDFSRSQCL